MERKIIYKMITINKAYKQLWYHFSSFFSIEKSPLTGTYAPSWDTFILAFFWEVFYLFIQD